MRKFVAYMPNGELFEAKFALQQFASIVSDERHLVAVETEAEQDDIDAALTKEGMPYLLLQVSGSSSMNSDLDLAALAELLSRP